MWMASQTHRADAARWAGALGIVILLMLAGPGSQLAAQQDEAKASYERLCQSCHGPTGAGDGPSAGRLKKKPASFSDTTVLNKSDEELARAISAGMPPMPSFGKRRTASQIKALVAYVRELGRKPR